MQSPLNSLLQKEMDRKDFLKHVAVGAVALTGASTIIKGLAPVFEGNQSNQQVGQSTETRQDTNSYGYGTSVYGGVATVPQTQDTKYSR